MLLYNQWVLQKTKRENFKTLETNENGNTTAQYIWEAAKAVPGKIHSEIELSAQTGKI